MSYSSIPSLDEESSCSSGYSTAESSKCSLESKPRAIFPSFWSKQTRESEFSACYKRKSGKPVCDSHGIGTSGQVLESPRAARRQIFQSGYQTESFPDVRILSLKQTETEERQIRYVRSAPSISDTTGRSSPIIKSVGTSCLRRSRFSYSDRPNENLECCTGSRNLSSANDSFVSFSSTVDVMLYQTPKELWSSDNWKNYFEF